MVSIKQKRIEPTPKYISLEEGKEIIRNVSKPRMEKFYLVKILEVIINDYEGFVPTENSISESMKEKYRWGNKTTRKRLNDLEALDLISHQRTGKGKQTKEYTLSKSQQPSL